MFGLKFGRKAKKTLQGSVTEVAPEPKPYVQVLTPEEQAVADSMKPQPLPDLDSLDLDLTTAERGYILANPYILKPGFLGSWTLQEYLNFWVDPDLCVDDLEDDTIHTGPRGGRYYKRTRVDGTTYKEYTW